MVSNDNNVKTLPGLDMRDDAVVHEASATDRPEVTRSERDLHEVTIDLSLNQALIESLDDGIVDKFEELGRAIFDLIANPFNLEEFENSLGTRVIQVERYLNTCYEIVRRMGDRLWRGDIGQASQTYAIPSVGVGEILLPYIREYREREPYAVSVAVTLMNSASPFEELASLSLSQAATIVNKCTIIYRGANVWPRYEIQDWLPPGIVIGREQELPVEEGYDQRQSILDHIVELKLEIDSRQSELDDTVSRAREVELSWARIGKALGIDRAAAMRRFDPEARRRHSGRRSRTSRDDS